MKPPLNLLNYSHHLSSRKRGLEFIFISKVKKEIGTQNVGIVKNTSAFILFISTIFQNDVERKAAKEITEMLKRGKKMETFRFYIFFLAAQQKARDCSEYVHVHLAMCTFTMCTLPCVPLPCTPYHVYLYHVYRCHAQRDRGAS